MSKMENCGSEIHFYYELREGKKMVIMQKAWEAQFIGTN